MKLWTFSFCKWFSRSWIFLLIHKHCSSGCGSPKTPWRISLSVTKTYIERVGLPFPLNTLTAFHNLQMTHYNIVYSFVATTSWRTEAKPFFHFESSNSTDPSRIEGLWESNSLCIDRHHKVSSFVKRHQNTHNSVKYEVIWKKK